MAETLALSIARNRVQSYKDSAGVVKDHTEAMECRDCEDFLQAGIEAFKWMVRADNVIRRGVFSGGVEYDPQVDEVLRILLVAWLKTCEVADPWIAVQKERGYVLQNVAEFNQCREEAEAIAENFLVLSEKLPEKMKELQAQALSDFRNGETSEFMEDL